MTQAAPIPARDLLEAIRAAYVEFVVLVPDTHQRTLLALIEAADDLQVVRASTEDEAVAICAGLIVGGRRPLLQIQHAGLFACVNNLRGVAIDGQFPLVMLIGLLGRDPARSPREHFGSMVRFTEPLLETLGIPYVLLDRSADIERLPEAFQEAAARRGPVALLVGMETA